MEYHEYGDQEAILHEGDKIEEYYYLIEGIVNCYKHAENLESSPNGQFLKQLGGPQSLGETVFSHSLVRSATYRAQETVRCSSIKCEVLRQLLAETLAENDEFEARMAEYMGIPQLAVGKLELIRFVRFREFTLRDRVLAAEEKRRPSIFFILKGECRMSATQQGQEVGLLNICRHDVIGVEILFEQKYRYNYTVTSESLCALEILASDLESFPQ